MKSDCNNMTDKYKPLLQSVITPRYVWKKFPSAQGWGGLLQGNDIKKHIENCDEVIIFAATLGLQVDELIRQTEASDMAGAVVLDALASAAIEQLCDEIESEIHGKYAQKAAAASRRRYSPGYGDFPLDVQGELLAALDAKKTIGLYVNKNNLLIPRKSVTAVIGCRERF
jgi:5-methyltetrahydrofolate--homocysteine methyltransferase